MTDDALSALANELTADERSELDALLADVLLPTLTLREREVARLAARSALSQQAERIRELEGLAYIGEHHFPDLTWKSRAAELIAEVASLRAELEQEAAAGTRHFRASLEQRQRAEQAERALEQARQQLAACEEERNW